MEATQALKLIKGRRSIRRFTDKEISKEALTDLVEAAVWAPSGSNAQAWEFVILGKKDKELMNRMVAFLPGVSEAPAAMIWLCLDRAKEKAKAGKLGLDVMGVMDISMAAQNIMLMAHAMGLGSCVIGSFNESVTRIALKLPEHVTPELLLILGYPAEEGFGPPRPPVQQNMHWREFGAKDI
ncbi:MAG: nitroreductase family protein [Oscillospiraceae bacterium]|nr:nitroreductase family protein [Oscillospiraceae bacterium]